MTTTRERKAEWARRRRRLVAYGKWEPTPMVDADPARHHVNSLRDFGISVPTIERLAGEGKGQMAQLIYGNQKTITAKRAERILAVRFDLDAIPPTKLVDASGTRRRIEALMCNGWSYTHIGRLIGGSRQLVTKHHNAKHVTAATARTIRDVYGILWDQPGPEPRAVNKARREGFAPPLAWDDDSIDDPNAHPGHGHPEATRRQNSPHRRTRMAHPAAPTHHHQRARGTVRCHPVGCAARARA